VANLVTARYRFPDTLTLLLANQAGMAMPGNPAGMPSEKYINEPVAQRALSERTRKLALR